MLKPPFKLTMPTGAAGVALAGGDCSASACCEHESVTDTAPQGRLRLADMDLHLHCSVIGTCLGTTELRKLMARFLFVRDDTDLQIHHEAVSHASQGGPIAKALQKLLDQRHESVVQRFARVRDASALTVLWDAALQQGEVPGAYWAVLTHRGATPELRQRVFGDVHMLSHLVGAANRADIRRLVALERENADLNDRLERQRTRAQQLIDERDAARLELRRCAAEYAVRQIQADTPGRPDAGATAETDALTARVAMQALRRERAEVQASAASLDARRLQQELDHLREQVQVLRGELAAAEVQLCERVEEGATRRGVLQSPLQHRRILYVGGRPSSTPAIRELVQRHGGEFQKHDGGLEDRKGLLESAVAWAQLVLFPVDCIDHDSAGRLKRLCAKLGTPFVPLRSASIASFAAAVSHLDDTASPVADGRRPAICLRHG